MPNCPKCGNSENVKNGKIKQKQRFHCKNCNNNFTKFKETTEFKAWCGGIYPDVQYINRMLLHLHLEGYSPIKIAETLKLPLSRVSRFIKKFGNVNYLRKSKNESQTIWESWKSWLDSHHPIRDLLFLNIELNNNEKDINSHQDFTAIITSPNIIKKSNFLQDFEDDY